MGTRLQEKEEVRRRRGPGGDQRRGMETLDGMESGDGRRGTAASKNKGNAKVVLASSS